jgi:glycogen debranching enzyme
MQPPLIAEAIEAIMLRGGSRAFLDEVLPKAKKLYDWLDRTRDPDRDGLIATLQPDESGLDHTPKYDAYAKVERIDLDAFSDSWKRIASANDAAGRDHHKMFEQDVFVVEDVLVNVIYAENQRVLARLFEHSGALESAREFSARAKKTSAALIEKCWHEEDGLFYDLAGRSESFLRVSTVSSLMPLLLADLPSRMADKLVEALRDPRRYGANYPVPTVARNEPSYVAGIVGTKLVWRGPSWINTNWYVARGLRRHGQDQLAQLIEDRSATLVERSGFREYYNPETNEGYGAEHFGWSGLVLDMLGAQDFAP